MGGTKQGRHPITVPPHSFSLASVACVSEKGGRPPAGSGVTSTTPSAVAAPQGYLLTNIFRIWDRPFTVSSRM